jgi:hypothetical protein
MGRLLALDSGPRLASPLVSERAIMRGWEAGQGEAGDEGMMWWVRAAFVLVALYIAVRAFLEFRGGVIHIRDTEEPTILIPRHERPVAYWAFVILFYSILAGMTAAVAFSSNH